MQIADKIENVLGRTVMHSLLATSTHSLSYKHTDLA